MTELGIYRKLPTTIEAIQFDGTNVTTINDAYRSSDRDRVLRVVPKVGVQLWVQATNWWVTIQVGEWVARDTAGCYPIQDAIFQANYESATVP